MPGNFDQAPQAPQQPMDMGRAAELLGLDSQATAEQIVAKYDSLKEGDIRTSNWEAERSILDEMGIPASVDRLVEDLRNSTESSASESNEKLPSMATIAESLQNLGFNVTENDQGLMKDAVQELLDGGDDGIHSLPVGTEKALGM